MDNNQNTQGSGRMFLGRPIWQWIVGILVLGLVAYGLVFFLMGHKSPQGQMSNNQNSSAVDIDNNPNIALISIQGAGFSPASITIKKGMSIRWVNNDAIPHTIVADKGDFKSSNIARGDAYIAHFDAVGTFSYHCSLHPNMKGTITVVE